MTFGARGDGDTGERPFSYVVQIALAAAGVPPPPPGPNELGIYYDNVSPGFTGVVSDNVLMMTRTGQYLPSDPVSDDGHRARNAERCRFMHLSVLIVNYRRKDDNGTHF